MIWKTYPFSLEWKFLAKNIAIIVVLCGIMWSIKEWKAVATLGRWELLGALFAFFVGYGVLLVVMNRKKVKLFIAEVKKLREKHL